MDSISNSSLAVTKILLGEAPDELPPLSVSESATETIWLVAREQSQYWKSVDPKECEPQDGLYDLFGCFQYTQSSTQAWNLFPSLFPVK